MGILQGTDLVGIIGVYDEDTFDEARHHFTADSDTALYDAEDDHDSFYESGRYE